MGGEYIGRVDLAQFVTRADLSALEERIVERVARACGRVSHASWDARPFADELRRKP